MKSFDVDIIILIMFYQFVMESVILFTCVVWTGHSGPETNQSAAKVIFPNF